MPRVCWRITQIPAGHQSRECGQVFCGGSWNAHTGGRDSAGGARAGRRAGPGHDGDGPRALHPPVGCEYLEGVTRNLRASTARNYADAFLPVHDRLGGRRLQGIIWADIEALVTWMLTSGRRRDGKAGTGTIGPVGCG
jgi:hypothetical protein